MTSRYSGPIGAIVVVALVCVATLAGGAILKGECFGTAGGDWRSETCYSDIPVLYHARGLDRPVFPYLHADANQDRRLSGFNEYPVLTGVVMWLTALPVAGTSEYLVLTMAVLAPFAVLVAVLLAREGRLAGLYWAAAPPLALYAFHNWDLLPVAALVAGVVLWRRDRAIAAAVMLGIGAAFKLFPGFVLIPMALERVRSKDVRGGIMVLLAGAGTFLVVNLPFLVASPSGWSAPYRFQLSRGADQATSVWMYLGGSVTWLSDVLVCLGLAAAVGLGWQRARRHGHYPTEQVAAAGLCWTLAVSKVGSPQYVLWVLPFFALLVVPARWWTLLVVVEVILYIGLFSVGVGGLSRDTADSLVEVAAWARAAVFLGCGLAFLNAHRRGPEILTGLDLRPAPLPGQRPAPR